MSNVCDCIEEEKAYLIINPDSVDKQEILSLNPPICYEEKSILSINGEMFAPGQTLNPSNPYTVGPYEEEGTTGGWIRWSVYYFGFASGYIYKPTHINVVINNRYHIFGEMAYGGGRCWPAPPFGTAYAGYSGRSFTNSGRPYSIEPADFIPNCSPNACGLTLNYLDSSTFNYGEVPCDVEISQSQRLEISDNSGILKTIDPYAGATLAFRCGERECPPETCCKPCTGSALNCCYDDAGKLIDSFVRRA